MSLSRRQGTSFAPTRRELLYLAGLLGVSLVTPVTPAGAAPELGGAEMAMLSQISDLIMPATDTGGATDAGVPEFIEMMVANWFDDAERDNFLSGMQAFANGAVTRFGRPFERLSAQEKSTYFGDLLAQAEADVRLTFNPNPLAQESQPRSPFVLLMKRLTLVGYYTSELGATTELSYAMVPDEHVACATSVPEERAESSAASLYLSFSAH